MSICMADRREREEIRVAGRKTTTRPYGAIARALVAWLAVAVPLGSASAKQSGLTKTKSEKIGDYEIGRGGETVNTWPLRARAYVVRTTRGQKTSTQVSLFIGESFYLHFWPQEAVTFLKFIDGLFTEPLGGADRVSGTHRVRIQRQGLDNWFEPGGWIQHDVILAFDRTSSGFSVDLSGGRNPNIVYLPVLWKSMADALEKAGYQAPTASAALKRALQNAGSQPGITGTWEGQGYTFVFQQQGSKITGSRTDREGSSTLEGKRKPDDSIHVTCVSEEGYTSMFEIERVDAATIRVYPVVRSIDPELRRMYRGEFQRMGTGWLARRTGDAPEERQDSPPPDIHGAWITPGSIYPVYVLNVAGNTVTGTKTYRKFEVDVDDELDEFFGDEGGPLSFPPGSMYQGLSGVAPSRTPRLRKAKIRGKLSPSGDSFVAGVTDSKGRTSQIEITSAGLKKIRVYPLEEVDGKLERDGKGSILQPR